MNNHPDIHSCRVTEKILGNIGEIFAHEVRNSLTSLQGFVQLLQHQSEGKSEYFDIMKQELEKINVLTSEYLVFNSSYPITFKKNNVLQMLKKAIDYLIEPFELKEINVKIEMSTSEHFIMCDEVMIVQLFRHILKNAYEESQNNGLIYINLSVVEKDKLKITISDQGNGIIPVYAHLIMNPFFTTKKNALGLGLAICNRIVDIHHGSIQIHSNENIGTDVEIFLPIFQ